MTNRRMVPKGRINGNGSVGVDNGSYCRKYDRTSLLGSHSPTSGRSDFRYSDPHVSTLYPGSSSSDSFENQLKQAANSIVTPDGRFIPQHSPRGSPAYDEEMSPSEGALQFVPAYESSTQMNKSSSSQNRTHNYNYSQKQQLHRQSFNDATWDAIIEDNDNDISQYQRRAKSMVCQASPSISPTMSHASETADSLVSGVSSSRKGSRIARLASIFSNRAANKSTTASSPTGTSTPTTSFTTSQNNSSMNQTPASPSQSSSSAGYLGWPGTQDKRGVAVAMQSDDSSVGATPRVLRFEEQSKGRQDGHMRDEDRTWMESDAFDNLSPVNKGTSPQVMVRSSISRITPREVNESKERDYYLQNSTQQNAADFHLAAAVADARAGRNLRSSPNVAAQNLRTNGSNDQYLFDNENNQFKNASLNEHWDNDDSATQSSGTNASKTSSAFFNESEVRNMTLRAVESSRARANKRIAAATVMRPKTDESQPPTEDALAINNKLSPPLRSFSNGRGYVGFLDKTKDVPNLMDEVDSDSLISSKANSHHSSAVRHYSAASSSSRHRSSLHTHDEVGVVPSNDTESDVFDEISRYSISDKNSDYDNLPNVTSGETHSSNAVKMKVNDSTLSTSFGSSANDISNEGGNGLKVVLLGGGLTTIQTTQLDFSNRQTASDFDDNLTNSDVDQYGFCRIPGFNEMASAGKNSNDSSLHRIESGLSDDILNDSGSYHIRGAPGGPGEDSGVSAGSGSGNYEDDESAFFSDFYALEEGNSWNLAGDLSQYYVQPSEVKKLVRKYRKLCKSVGARLRDEEFETHEDDKKAFALFEMRSRIMEKDMERGLERRGGTVPVDDLVLTTYNRTGLRIRDAVIVSKAWRDGASPMDVINTALLTQRDEKTHFIKRPVHRGGRSSDDSALWNDFRAYWWEQVTWVDDTDFMLFRCPSLGPRHMRGFEMFTIGDCQSILLKLTNERCMELRTALNEATARQIIAEEMMKEEGDEFEGMMTEAEMRYLSSMEEVKTMSKKLVAAERSFTLVRDRIESLVARYESLLVKIENQSCAASSVITYESSCYSDTYSEHSIEEDRERKLWARRAQRAEIRAELAAREALLAQKEPSHIHIDKHRELEDLQDRLTELQSEPSTAASRERQHSVVLAKAIAAKHRYEVQNRSLENKSTVTTQTKVNDVKQRFRERMAARTRRASGGPSETGGYVSSVSVGPQNNLQHHPIKERDRTPRHHHVSQGQHKLFRSAGEEMCQHLGFYERSLKAVENSRR